MTVQTVTWSTIQQSGFGQAVGPFFWTTLAFPWVVTIDIDPVQSVGVIFDARVDQGLRTTTIGGDTRCLDNPVIQSCTLRCTLQRSHQTVVDPLEIGMVPDPQPADFATGTTSIPWFRGEVLVGTVLASQVAVSPLNTTLDVLLDGVSVRAFSTSRARWNGRFALSFRSTTDVATEGTYRVFNNVAFPIQVVTQQEVFFAGMTGGPAGKIRAVRDGRYAMPAWNTDLVRDGDQPGLFVRPFDWDPEDEHETYRPKPGEGTVDDEVPNL